MGGYNPSIDNPIDDLASQAGQSINNAASRAGQALNRAGASVMNSIRNGISSAVGDKVLRKDNGDGTFNQWEEQGAASQAQQVASQAVNAAKQIAVDAAKKAAAQAVRTFVAANLWWIAPTLGVVLVICMIFTLVFLTVQHYKDNPTAAVWDCGLGVIWSEESRVDCVKKVTKENIESIQTGFEEGSTLQNGRNF